MKTDQKNKKAFRAPSHPEQSTDTNPERLYRVTLFREHHYSGGVTLLAASPQQAMRRASAMAKNMVIDWRLYAETITAHSTELLKERESHD